jgi:hypothetical protein
MIGVWEKGSLPFSLIAASLAGTDRIPFGFCRVRSAGNALFIAGSVSIALLTAGPDDLCRSYLRDIATMIDAHRRWRMASCCALFD